MTETFEQIWEQHVMSLVGRTLSRPNGSTNVILYVDWHGVYRLTENDEPDAISIKPFRWAVERLQEWGVVTSAEVHERFPRCLSAGVMLILGHVPGFKHLYRPSRIVRR